MADEPEGTAKSSPMSTILVLLLLTLIGAGTGFAVGALLGTPPAAEEVKLAGEVEGVDLAPDDSKKAKPAKAGKKEEGGHGASSSTGGDDGGAAVIAAFATPPLLAEDEPLTVVALPPIITNLAAPRDVWLRVEASILVQGGGGHGNQEVLAAKVGADLLTYLRTLSLQDIEGASAFLAFRDDLDDQVRTLSHGAVAKVLIKSLVVE
jgi:flagellar FliL protein